MMPEFDPSDMVNEFVECIKPELQVEDEPLALHVPVARILAQFCLWRQPGRDRGRRSDWSGLPFRDLVHEPDFGQALNAIRPGHPTPTLALWTPLYWYARMRVLRDLPTDGDLDGDLGWTACRVVETLDAVHGQLASLPLIYLESAHQAGEVLLDGPGRQPPEPDTLDQIERIAFALLGSPLPGDHVAPKYGAMLLEQAQRARHTRGHTTTAAPAPYLHSAI